MGTTGSFPKPTVVIIDDSAEVATMLADLLELRGGFEVLDVAPGAAAGVASVLLHEPDVALIDFALGDGDGAEVVRRLRECGVRAVLVVASGMPIETIRDAVLAAGADACLSKSDAARIPDLVLALLRRDRPE